MDIHAQRGQPLLSIIDFDAFVAQAGGATMALSAGEGGTYGTEGYCPPDLVERAKAGDLTVAPYSDRYSRDMLLLELLLAGPGFPPESPPSDWDRGRMKRQLAALRNVLGRQCVAATRHLDPDTVFGLPEDQRPASVELATKLGISVPQPGVKPLPVPKPPAPSRTRRAPAPTPARTPWAHHRKKIIAATGLAALALIAILIAALAHPSGRTPAAQLQKRQTPGEVVGITAPPETKGEIEPTRPFDATEAKRRQQKAARALGLKGVEEDVNLGGA